MKRNHLFVLPKMDNNKFKQLETILDTIEKKLDLDENIQKEIAVFHEIAGKENFYNTYSFETYWKSSSKEEFIEDILLPLPPIIENISEEELLFVLKKFEDGTIGSPEYFLELLKKNTNYSYSISDLIYWPNQLGYDLKLSSEEMARILYTNETPPKEMPPPIISL